MARSKAHEKGGNNGNGNHQPQSQGANNNRAWGGAPRPNGYAQGGSFGWTSYNPDNYHSNSYSWDNYVSPSKVFCGTSVVDFTFWVQNFTMEATIAGVWDMIAPPDGATAAMTVALNGVAGNVKGLFYGDAGQLMAQITSAVVLFIWCSPSTVSPESRSSSRNAEHRRLHPSSNNRSGRGRR